jgi:PIN domain nuclease of toxin-antitoxin system
VLVLLDTHALLWWLNDDPKLTKRARAVIANTNNSILVSAASAWEIATKVRIGKLPDAVELAHDFESCLIQEQFLSLSISSSHATRAGLLPGPHRDPFDRILVAQAQEENVPILSKEVVFDRYGIQRIW